MSEKPTNSNESHEAPTTQALVVVERDDQGIEKNTENDAVRTLREALQAREAGRALDKQQELTIALANVVAKKMEESQEGESNMATDTPEQPEATNGDISFTDYKDGKQPIVGDFNEQIPGQMGMVEAEPKPSDDKAEKPEGGPATVKVFVGNDAEGNPQYEDYPYNPAANKEEEKAEDTDDKAEKPEGGPATVKVFVGNDAEGNPQYEDYPYNTSNAEQSTTAQASPEENTEKSLVNMSLNELTTEWAKARDNKDVALGTSVQDEILRRVLAEKNIPDDHKQALMDRMSAMADAKRKNSDDGTEKTPTPSEKVEDTTDTGEKEPDENISTLVYVENKIDQLTKELTEAKTDEDKARIENELAELKDYKERLGSTLLGNTEEAEPKFNDKNYEDMSIEELNAIRLEALENKDATTVTNVVNEIASRRNKPEDGKKVPTGDDGEKKPTDGDDGEKKPTDGDDGEKKPTDGDDDGEKEPTDGDDDGEKEPTDDDGEKKPGEDNKKEEAPLKFFAGYSNVEQEILRTAMEIDERDQANSRFKKSRNIFKAVSSMIKHNALFKLNTQTMKAKEIIDFMRQEAGDRPLTYEDLAKAMEKSGVTLPETTHRAFLQVIAGGIEGMGVKIDAPTETKDEIKKLALDYVTYISSAGLTEEQRTEAFNTYKAKIAEVSTKAVGVEKGDISIYADNAAELLTRLSATALHDKAIDNVKNMINQMEISFTEAQIGANNNMDVSYLQKIDKLGKKWNTASIIGKTAFVASAWIATGVVAGLAVKGAKQSAMTGSSIVIGTAMAGPIGALVAIGVSAIGSAAWGRYMARRRESEKANMFSSNVNEDNGFSMTRKGQRMIKPYLNENGEFRADLTDADRAEAENIMQTEKKATPAEILKPEQESMATLTSDFMRYMKPAEGLPADWDKSDVSNYVMKSADELTIDEKQGLAMLYAKVAAKVDVENKYNEQAKAVADQEASRSRMAKTISSSNKVEGRAVNLLSAKAQETFLTEKVNLMLCLQKAGELIEKNGIQDMEVQVQVGDPEAATVKNIKISELMAIEDKTERSVSTDNISKWQKRVVDQINKTGRKSAFIAGGITLAAGLGSAIGLAYIAEKRSGGQAETLFDIFSKKNNLPPGKIEPVTVTKNGNDLTFTTKDGTQLTYRTDASGKLAQTDLDALKALGIEVTQNTTTTTANIPSTEALENLGGFKSEMRWLHNDTLKIDGTELGGRWKMLPDGSVEFWQNPGTASGGGESFDVVTEALNGNMRLRFANQVGPNEFVTVLSEPMQVVNGVPKITISPNSELYQFFNVDTATGEIEGLVNNIGATIMRPGALPRSIDTVVNKAGEITTTLTDTATEAVSKIGAHAAKFFAFVTGYHTPGTKSGYDGNMKKPTGKKPEPQQPDGSYAIPGSDVIQDNPTEGTGEKPEDKPTDGTGEKPEDTTTGATNPTGGSTPPPTNPTGATPIGPSDGSYAIPGSDVIQDNPTEGTGEKPEDKPENKPTDAPKDGEDTPQPSFEDKIKAAMEAAKAKRQQKIDEFQKNNPPTENGEKIATINIPEGQADYSIIVTDLERKRKEVWRKIAEDNTEGLSDDVYERKIKLIDELIEQNKQKQKHQLIDLYNEAILKDKNNGSGPSPNTLAIRAEMDRIGL